MMTTGMELSQSKDHRKGKKRLGFGLRLRSLRLGPLERIRVGSWGCLSNKTLLRILPLFRGSPRSRRTIGLGCIFMELDR